jgi:stage III sporulation protein AA
MIQAVQMNQILPYIFFNGIQKIDLPKRYTDIEEIRIRAGRPVIFWNHKRELFLKKNGTLSYDALDAYIPCAKEILNILDRMTEHSMYAYQKQLTHGYVTLEGGHRVGVIGKVLVEGGEIKTLFEFTGLNFRVGRQVMGCSQKLIPYILKERQVQNTLILSPPGAGKTTMLRDLAKQLSDGIPQMEISGMKVGIVDERYEIRGPEAEGLNYDLGMRTDVLSGSPKDLGILMMMRTMSPHVILTDEIGDDRDFYAIQKMMHAGIKIITSYHGNSILEEKKRHGLQKFIQDQLFDRIVVLSARQGPGTLEEVYDVATQSLIKERELCS